MRISYISPDGRETPLTENGPLFVLEDGFKTFVGQIARSEVSASGRPGVRPGALTIGAMKATLPVHIHHVNGTVSVQETWERWRADWSLTRDGVLRFEGTHPLGTLLLAVRLESIPAGVGKDLREVESLTVDVPVYASDGVFYTTPINTVGAVGNGAGHVPVYPSIVWEGAGGKVTAPSGATFVLPAVEERRQILLDPEESYVVLTPNREVDEALTETLWGEVFAEPTMPGESDTWILPAGAEMQYQVGVLDPWGGAL